MKAFSNISCSLGDPFLPNTLVRPLKAERFGLRTIFLILPSSHSLQYSIALAEPARAERAESNLPETFFVFFFFLLATTHSKAHDEPFNDIRDSLSIVYMTVCTLATQRVSTS